MLFSDTYKTIAQPHEAEYKDKGSRFIAYAFPIDNSTKLKEHLLEIKKLHPSASHHCYACVIGFDQGYQKSSDDGEPSNTAGKPILRAILSHQLTNVLIVVVRYFGGKLLGVSGLINAYSQAAIDVLTAASIIEQTVVEQYQLVVDFEKENDVFKILKQYNLKVSQLLYGNQITIIFDVRKSLAGSVLNAFVEKHRLKATFISQR